MSEMKTPAMTVLEDIARLKESRRDRHRRLGNIRSARRRILDEKLVNEDLYALYKIDPQGAINRYRAMQDEAREESEAEYPSPDKSLSDHDKKTIARARSLKGTTRNWLDSAEEKYFDRLEDTADDVRTHIARDEEVINWLRGCIPSIAEYTGEEGKTSFSKDDVVETRVGGPYIDQYGDVQESRLVSFYYKSDAYRSLIGGFNGFIDKFQNKVEEYKEQLVMYESDPIADIVDGIEGLGLVRIHEDVNDGCLWFEDDDGQDYFYSLYRKAPSKYITGPHVLHDYMPNHQKFEKFEEAGHWHVDLGWYALRGASGEFRTPESIARDYFGAWDYLRDWISIAVKSGEPAPDHFPVDLTLTKQELEDIRLAKVQTEKERIEREEAERVAAEQSAKIEEAIILRREEEALAKAEQEAAEKAAAEQAANAESEKEADEKEAVDNDSVVEDEVTENTATE